MNREREDQNKISETGFQETADIDTASDDYASRFAGITGQYFLDVQSRITLDLLKDLPNVSVLDVGGGHAQLAVPLVKAGYNVTVTGSDQTTNVRLRRLLEKGSYQHQVCDCLHLPFADNQFEVVMAFRLLPHVTHWQRLLSEMCRVAGKAVILDYPDRRSANILYDILFDLKKKMEGNTRSFLLFSRHEITQEFIRNNFNKPVFRPEFFAPMVLHRKMKVPVFSKYFEALFYYVGLTNFFGSPIIIRSNKRG